MEWRYGASYKSGDRRQKFRPGMVLLKMKDRGGDALRNPAECLNEARLTAIGICLYLAGLSRSTPPRRSDNSTFPRILVLDDVLLSLDMAHRLPLLKVLKSSEFNSWQILLLTHDRAWYEIARQRLGDGWMRCELFAQRVGDYEQPLQRLDQDHLDSAIDFLSQGHVKAAAVHIRTKFEEVLKWGCSELRLAVRYELNPRDVSARDFWNAVSGAEWEDIPPVGRITDARRRQRWWQPSPVKTAVVSAELRDRISHALSWVMNPLSHSQSVDRYASEIEDAIFAVGDLEQAIRHATAMRQVGPVLLQSMLISVLKSRK